MAIIESQSSGGGLLNHVPARWIRPPRNGERESHTGLTHSVFYAVLKQAGHKVKTLSLRTTGRARGCRMVWLPSLMEYLHAQAIAQQTKNETREGA